MEVNEKTTTLAKRGIESKLIGLELFLGIAMSTAKGIIIKWSLENLINTPG